MYNDVLMATAIQTLSKKLFISFAFFQRNTNQLNRYAAYQQYYAAGAFGGEP